MKRKTKTKKSRGVPLWAVFIVTGIVLILIAIVLFLKGYGDVRSADAYLAVLEEEHAQDIKGVVNSVQLSLTGTSGTTRVFDKNNRLIFVLRNSTGVGNDTRLPDTFSRELKSSLLNGAASIKLVRDDWIHARAKGYPGFQQIDLEERLSRSIGAATVDAYCEHTHATVTEDAKFLIAMELETRFTEDELLLYIASISNFGGMTGIQTAAATLFGKELSDLSDHQLKYLLYLHYNQDASWDEWREAMAGSVSMLTLPTLEQSGLISTSSINEQALRRLVESELHSILGARMESENFDVEILIDDAMQYDLQTALDTAMAPSITLQSDGQTALDGTVMIIDSETGMLVAYVAGRSINNREQFFKLNEQSKLGIYEQARALFATDTYKYNTLVSYRGVDESADYISMKTLLQTNRLDLLNLTPVLAASTELDELAKFSLSMYLGAGATPKLVSRVVLTGTDNQVYAMTIPTSQRNSRENTNMRMLFAESATDIVARYRAAYPTGQVFSDMTSKYIVCGIVGSDTLGYGLTEDDNDLLTSTVARIVSVPEKYFTGTYRPVVDVPEFAEEFTEQSQTNQSIIDGLVTIWVEDLETREISSKVDRVAFEDAYMLYTTELSTYADVLGQSNLSAQMARLDDVRTKRSNELLAYVA